MGSSKHSPSITAVVTGGMMALRALVRRVSKRKQQEHDILTAVPRYPAAAIAPTTGEPGHLLMQACAALKAAGVPPTEIREFVDDALSDDYGHLLVTVARWVTVNE